jgi:hypothetical protein
MKTFIEYLIEATTRLDIKIKTVAKYLGKPKKGDVKLKEVMTSPCIIEAKTDGIKISIYKTEQNTGDFKKDWIIAYKNEIQYHGEHDFASDDDIKRHSISNAQFKMVFDHFEKITKPNIGIPSNTELFIEFLMNKPTLSSNYTKKHGMILIASSPTTYTVNYGRINSKPDGFDTSNRNKYADILKLDVPLVLFEGTLDNFEDGIILPELKDIWKKL